MWNCILSCAINICIQFSRIRIMRAIHIRMKGAMWCISFLSRMTTFRTSSGEKSVQYNNFRISSEEKSVQYNNFRTSSDGSLSNTRIMRSEKFREMILRSHRVYRHSGKRTDPNAWSVSEGISVLNSALVYK